MSAQFQSKPATLEELAAMIKHNVAQKAANKGRKLKGTRDVQSETESKEQKAANKIAKAIEDELKWRPSKFVLLTHHQHCDCGEDYRSVVGLFLESRHEISGARRLGRPRNLLDLDRLPHQKEETNEFIGVCPHCLLTRELLEAMFSPIHPSTIQLPLFGHTPQRRACT